MNYAKTRNYKNGAVTLLGPYISRGVISTKQITTYIFSLGLEWNKIEKLIQELAWRDYWQLVWINKKDQIFTDLKNSQLGIENHKIPKAIVNAQTNISAVDDAIRLLYSSGYMHNHMRMYVASICCNIAKCHWEVPSKWLYSHLYDGDLASNSLSWQWVAGTFSNKKYFANQSNINKYFETTQVNTFLDVEYSDFARIKIPEILIPLNDFNLECLLPNIKIPKLKNTRTLVYNYYNLDPTWHRDEAFQRVLLLEPSFFSKYPITKKCLDFAVDLSNNLENIQIFIGEFEELNKMVSSNNLFFKEHPTVLHYKGNQESRDWIFDTKDYYPSFFKFWNKCKKELKKK